MSFSIEQATQNSIILLSIKGSIDEEAKFPELKLAQIKRIVLDLDGVKLINSCGIREWIRWISKFSETVEIQIENCSKAIVDQFNMVDGFLPKDAVVKSFDVPYYCESCENVTTVRCQRENAIQETVKCTQCGKTAEVDVIMDRFLKFMRQPSK